MSALTFYNGSSIIVTNNRFLAGVQFPNGINISMFNNILPVQPQTQGNVNFANNIFYATCCNIFNGSYCNFENNIFTGNTSLNFGGLGSSYSGNISGISLASLFTNLPNPGTFTYLDDCHVLPNSVGHNGGTDSTDIGMYGGWYPWKEAAMPQNPHIRTVNISSYNNPQGDIQVDIKVGAQSH